MSEIKLIVGLGNPGDTYERTRHNAGFWFVDLISGGNLRKESRFHGLCGEIQIGGLVCRLLEPQTFMNKSGLAVRAITDYYRFDPGQILIVHDDIDLQPGTVRIKRGGGHGGHNGLRDIIAALGGRKDFFRLRIGVGHPGHRDQVVDYVLHRPGVDELAAIEVALDSARDVLPDLLSGEAERAMHVLHSA